MQRRQAIQLGSTQYEIVIDDSEDGRVRLQVGGKDHVFSVQRLGEASWSLVTDGGGPAYVLDYDPKNGVVSANAASSVELIDARKKIGAAASRPQTTGPVTVKSPMPGKVIKVLVTVGATVKSGQGLVVVEAMKMENEIRAPRDGRVNDVKVSEGQTVESMQPLLTLG